MCHLERSASVVEGRRNRVITAFAVYSAVVTLLSLPILVWHNQRTGVSLTIPLITLFVAAILSVVPGVILAVLLDRGNAFAQRYWWLFAVLAFLPQIGVIGFVFLLPLLIWLYRTVRSAGA